MSLEFVLSGKKSEQIYLINSEEEVNEKPKIKAKNL